MTQLGYLELAESPGQPLKSTTTGTPSFSASRMVLRLTSLVVRGARRVRVQRIAVAAQRADGEAFAIAASFEFGQFGRVVPAW